MLSVNYFRIVILYFFFFYSLETAKARVEAAQSEAKVMDEYRELVDTARRNLQV